MPSTKHKCTGNGLPLGLLLMLNIGFLLIACDGKEFERCELARKLVEDYNIEKTLLSTWVCVIEHESERNTAAVRRSWDGSHGYGLFQLSDKNACGKDRPDGMCNKRCADFANDNIDDDVVCAQHIQNELGFKYWNGFNTHCTNWNSLRNLKILCNSDTFTRRPPITRRSYDMIYG